MPAAYYKGSTESVLPVNDEFISAGNPKQLYELLSGLWCAETCAPRMRKNWTPENKTLGQCSVTAFLAQDIYGGEVYGIQLKDGNVHCYNVVGDCVFDLTCEQFGNKVLCYEENSPQTREQHFAKAEKRARYEMLKKMLLNRLTEKLSENKSI